MLKMYIAVLDQVPDHMVPVLVAHTVLNAHLAWKESQMYQAWLIKSFKKVVVKVNRKEFDKIAEIPGVFGGFENSTLEGRVSCIVVMPREVYPNVIKFAHMWTPNAQDTLNKIPNELRFHYDA